MKHCGLPIAGCRLKNQQLAIGNWQLEMI